MNILYVASAIALPGTSGGAIHVQEVAEGLARRGHRVHVVARRGGQNRVDLGAGITTTLVPVPDKLALLSYPAVALAARSFRPDAIMERYYNFAGAGMLLARRHHLPALLEVNAPMVDPPSSRKDRLDRALGRPLRRWAVRQALWSGCIVTPLASTVPLPVPRSHVETVSWGANVERFRPTLREEQADELAALRAELGLPEDALVVVFVGSFRAWHGVQSFVEAAIRLIPAHPRLYFLAVGGGPELGPVQARVAASGLPAADRERVIFTGPQPHERVPLLLALAGIGVAPFGLAAYPPLQTFGFYWSPLKVFEYMAMGLPVVTPAIPPLATIIRPGREGVLYPEGDTARLASAIAVLATDPDGRVAMGARARERVVAHYSWDAHCAQLERVLEALR
ncbi:MAG TPA: glycosyltransferase family 4 protein [Chloroflexia bacterium]|nr:glycosyltransferase family 4 protein [Chloroflexia bacterium]